MRPTEATRRPPPSIPMHWITRAPELSAASKRVIGMIIFIAQRAAKNDAGKERAMGKFAQVYKDVIFLRVDLHSPVFEKTGPVIVS